jgi:hypothetical protein
MTTNTLTSLLCVRSRNLASVAIAAWDADHSSYTAIRIRERVIDATLRHGVARQTL